MPLFWGGILTTAHSLAPASLSPVSGVTTWLIALAFMFIGGLGLAAAGAALAIASGLPVPNAVALISDPGSSPLLTSPTWIAATILVNELAVAGAVWLALRRLGLRFSEVVPLRRPAALDVFAALLLAFGLAPVAELCAELVYRYVSRDLTSEQVVLAVARGSSSAGFVVVLVIAAIVPALVEESLCRGILFRSLERYGPTLTISLTSLLFGALHLEPTQAAGTIVLGVAFGLTRWHSGSVLPSIIGHGLYNAAVMTSERWLASGARHELAPGRALFGALAAVFGWWLISGRRWRAPAL